MPSMTKFSAQMDPETLEALRAHAKAEGRTLASVLTEAARLYLEHNRVRPAFRDAAREVMDENDALLRRLAK